MDIPLIVTEQNPGALGETVSEIDKSHAIGTYPKTQFSMCIPEVIKQMDNIKDLHCVVLFGIETHACIEQTAIGLRGKGLQVHVVADACSSRSVEDRFLAFEVIYFFVKNEAFSFKFFSIFNFSLLCFFRE